MDLKDSKTQKILLGALAFFIVAFFWYTRFYSPLDDQIAERTREFETLTTNLKNVELKAKSLDALKLEYQDLVERYAEIEELLPEVKQIPSFLVQLHTASSITGTRITRIAPRDVGAQDFYNVASFDIEMTGTYHDFGTFMSYIANFPFIANVSDVRLEALEVAVSEAPAEGEGGLQELKKEESIKAVFTLSTYYVKEGERLQELVL